MAMFGNGRRKPPANVFATVNAREPTLREKATGWLAERLGDDREAYLLAERIFGSPQRAGLADLTPLALAFGGQEAGRQIGTGRPGNIFAGAAELALAGAPVPAAKNALKKPVQNALKTAPRKASLPLPDGASEALDMSREARMARARAQGFDTDTVYYHGTPGRIVGDLRPTGPEHRRGVYVSPDPAEASMYAVGRAAVGQGDTPQVLPLLVREGAAEPTTEWANLIRERMVRDPNNIRSLFDPFNPFGDAYVGLPPPGAFRRGR